MTQRQMVREISGHDNEYEPDPKLGAANNARIKAAWDAKNDALDDPGLITICGDFKMEMCRETSCDREGAFLCDWPMGRGKTCDLPLCSGPRARDRRRPPPLPDSPSDVDQAGRRRAYQPMASGTHAMTECITLLTSSRHA
jgi:hypothetical protein